MRGERLCVLPAGEMWLRALGLRDAGLLADLPGEVVSGHTDRHVRRCLVGRGPTRRLVFLKREHRVRAQDRLKHALAGAGLVSKSEREALTLLELERADIPAPRVLAHGRSAAGVGFLLVDAVPDAVDLRRAMLDADAAGRRRIASAVGTLVAQLAAAGFDNPDLSAKHVLLSRGTAVALDWQNARRAPSPDSDAGMRMLARLHATLAPALASPRERLEAWRAFAECFPWDRGHPGRSSPPPRSRFGLVEVQRIAQTFAQSRAVRADLAPVREQTLVWLDGEAVCAVPRHADAVSAVAVSLYAGANGEMTLTLPDGTRAVLTRRKVRWSFGRVWAALRGRSWRSPELVAARRLFADERAGAPAPRLIAFGQRLTPFGGASFLLTEERRHAA